jgi:Outer membrane protein beta-barrel domain
MIRTLLFSILCFTLTSSYAQVKFGVQAGYNAAKWKYTITPGNWDMETTAISSFNAGMLAQLDFKRHIRLQGSLLFNGTGTELRYRYRYNQSWRTIRLYSLNLPVVAMYKIDVKKMSYSLGGGFYAAYMLSGTDKGTIETYELGGAPTINLDLPLLQQPAPMPLI